MTSAPHAEAKSNEADLTEPAWMNRLERANRMTPHHTPTDS